MLHPEVQFGDVFDRITMGICDYIKQKPGICDINFGHYEAASIDLIESWEEDNSCKLPLDLRNFYTTLNGLLIEWNIELNDEKHPIGRIEVNPLESVVLVTKGGPAVLDNDISLKDLDLENETDKEGHKKPNFSDKYFELSSDEAYGKVCLVYKDNKPNTQLCEHEIWFLDYSLQWIFLADSFTLYFRMLIIHIGIPGWQYLYTDVGLSRETNFWFSMYIPYRLPGKCVNLEQHFALQKETEKNKPDLSCLFKGKSSEKRKADLAKQMKNQTGGKVKKTVQSRTSHKR